MNDLAPKTSSPATRLFVSINRWALIALLAVMAALVIGNVFSRYLFGHSFSWVEELTRYMMIWLAFLGLGPALRAGGHIAIDSLPQALPPAAALVLRALLVAVMGVTLAALVKLGWDYAEFGWEQESPVLGWSYGKIYLAIPLGSAVALLHLLLLARHWITGGQWEKVEGYDPQAV
jgi:TRAP-type C4-dicarboxylate transport system permease small subunit